MTELVKNVTREDVIKLGRDGKTGHHLLPLR